MSLQTTQTVDHMYTDFFHLAGPGNIRLFVKTGLQFYHCSNLLPILSSVH